MHSFSEISSQRKPWLNPPETAQLNFLRVIFERREQMTGHDDKQTTEEVRAIVSICLSLYSYSSLTKQQSSN